MNTTMEYTSHISAATREKILSRVSGPFSALLESMQIDQDLYPQLNQVYIPLAATIQKRFEESEGALVVGINGAQGSGKSTLCTLLEMILKEGFGLMTTSLSIDDLYLTRQQRTQLSETVHPLLKTRGVPGTHDTKLGTEIIKQLCQTSPGHLVRLPVFDKAVDDRRPADSSRDVTTPVDIVLFEGWCVGAAAQEESSLSPAINSLEAEEDANGNWRHYVNQQLASSYADLFSHIDLLIMLKVPSFECVYEWRNLQESKLANQASGKSNLQIMDEDALRRFIMHYERLTRHALEEMPKRADIVLPLNRNHLIERILYNVPAEGTRQSP